MSLFQISREIEFDAGHRVPNHASKCRNPHGHRYRVRAYLEGELDSDSGSSSEGMVQDFGCVKDVMMREIHDSLDHGFMVYQKDQVLFEALTYSGQHWKIIATDFIPTAENLAKWCFDILRISFEVQLQYVEVWETPTSMARYPALVTL